MKYLLPLVFVSACASYDLELIEHLEAERDFHSHMEYRAAAFEKYDLEYISDCLYYQDLNC